MTTSHIDAKIKSCILSHGAHPSFLGYGGFPASACISVNDQVIHGIPSPETVLKDGDIVKIDVGAFYKGYHGDCAATFAVGSVSEEAERLIRVTEASFYKGIEQALPDRRIGDIGAAIEGFVRENGFTVVRDFIGHGVGEKLHEDPEVPNYGIAGRGVRLRSGMTLPSSRWSTPARRVKRVRRLDGQNAGRPPVRALRKHDMRFGQRSRHSDRRLRTLGGLNWIQVCC